MIAPSDALRGNVTALLDAIDLMVEQQRVLAALTLIYAGIDAIASLERRKSERNGRAAFLRWADAFLLRDERLPCTALELYGARCGILHTFSADSDLSRGGEVRRVIYARGHSVSRGALDGVLRRQQRTDVVALHLSDLQDAFRAGVFTFLVAVASDEARWDAVMEKAVTWLIDIDAVRRGPAVCRDGEGREPPGALGHRPARTRPERVWKPGPYRGSPRDRYCSDLGSHLPNSRTLAQARLDP